MAVEVLGMGGEIDGYGDSMRDFRQSHEGNTAVLLNLAEGKKKNAPRAPYDPNHPDNVWPVMVYHPEKGELVVGVNLKDLTGNLRKEKEAGNKAALSIAFKSGYRAEPYLKPQIAVYDAATEKAALQARNRELEGHIVSQGDLLAKLVARLEAIEGAK